MKQPKYPKKANVVYTFSKTSGFIYSTSGGSYAGICVNIISKFEQYVKTKYGITTQAKFYTLDAQKNALYITYKAFLVPRAGVEPARSCNH